MGDITKGDPMKKFIDNLKIQAQENPVVAVLVGAAGITAITKLMQANTERANSKSWAKEVDRRRMNTK
jgi:hypothetical protein